MFLPIIQTNFSRNREITLGCFIHCNYCAEWSILCAAIAGWSSLVARRAHNPKAVGSNPTPATNFTDEGPHLGAFYFTGFLVEYRLLGMLIDLLYGVVYYL